MLLMIHGSCFIHLYIFFWSVRFSSQTETFYIFMYVVNLLGNIIFTSAQSFEFLPPTKLSSFSLAPFTLLFPTLPVSHTFSSLSFRAIFSSHLLFLDTCCSSSRFQNRDNLLLLGIALRIVGMLLSLDSANHQTASGCFHPRLSHRTSWAFPKLAWNLGCMGLLSTCNCKAKSLK